jgi:hypothetical protein
MATESTRGKPSGILSLLWALFFFFVFALFVTIWIRWTGPGTAPQDQRSQERATKRQELDQADREKLSAAGFVDKEKGIVRIPLAEAKKIMLAELKTPVVPSQVKVEPPLPMPAAADPNATEPPPMALPSAPQGADTFRFQLPESNTVPATPASGGAADAVKTSGAPVPANATAEPPNSPQRPPPPRQQHQLRRQRHQLPLRPHQFPVNLVRPHPSQPVPFSSLCALLPRAGRRSSTGRILLCFRNDSRRPRTSSIDE